MFGLGFQEIVLLLLLALLLFGSRRLNCLGVLLLPIACNMSGIGEPVAAFLGLL